MNINNYSADEHAGRPYQEFYDYFCDWDYETIIQNLIIEEQHEDKIDCMQHTPEVND